MFATKINSPKPLIPAFLSPLFIIRKPWYQLGRIIVDVFTRSMLKMDIAGKERIPAGPVIFAANHPSTTDPIYLTALVNRQISILIIETLFKIPLVGHSLELCGHIRVSAGEGQKAVAETMSLLKKGASVGIFPEGAISPRDGCLAPVHTGVARLALASGVPVVPVGIALEKDLLRAVTSQVDGQSEVAHWYTRGHYSVTFGEPIYFTGSSDDRRMVRQVTDQIAEKITTLSRESHERLKRNLLFPSGHPLWTIPIRLPLRFVQGLIGLA